MESVSGECEPVEMSSEDPLFMLYTSGSTGKPKGIVHSTAGYILYASVTHKVSRVESSTILIYANLGIFLYF